MVGTRNAPRFSAALAGFALVATVALGSARAADAPTIPVDVRVPVELTAPISSQTAHVGDAFAFKTTQAETLGALAVPAGTPGTGRLAAVEVAHDKQHGSLTLQADQLQLAGGQIVWVNIDPSKPPTGRLADKHTRLYLIPIIVGVVPGVINVESGNLILDTGTAFRVVTTAPRAAPAPLLTASPSPASPAPSPSATSAASPAPSPAPSPTAT